ncbi:MAG: hypothetical protein KAQ91_00915 [Methylococcales bacterium]|nr:hypothetical protein [Methylococcales bacterium]
MKISKLTKGLLVSLLLSAAVVVEAADSKYPATDFQPKVVYQDTGYKHTGSTTSSSKAKFEGEVSAADPDFPAANFEPEVLFQDKGYKHKKDTASSSSASAPATSSSVVEAEAEAVSEESSMSLIMGLAVLAIAGFVFYSKSAKKTTPVRRAAARPAVATARAGEAVSGVDKYLEGRVGVKPSGVSKYLEERNTAVSGVSKYVAKQKVSARLASVTGVEKYLKDRG